METVQWKVSETISYNLNLVYFKAIMEILKILLLI